MKTTLRLTLAAAALVAALPAASHAELLYGVTFDNQLISFDSATPNVLNSGSLISGLNGSDLVGISFRPSTGGLYGVTTDSRVITINTTNGVSTTVGTLGTPLNGTNFGVDFNPVADAIRITSDTKQNLRVNPTTAATTVDGTINYVDGTTTPPQVSAVAYTNRFSPAPSTTKLYGLDAFDNTLVSFDSPNGGTIRRVGSLGFNSSGLTALTISGLTGTAYASIQSTGVSGSSLYTVNLATGATMSSGVIGPGGAVLQLRGLTVAPAPVPEPASLAVIGVGFAALLRRRRK